MRKTRKPKETLTGNMPSEEVLAQGRKLFADLMKHLDKNKLFLMFDPDDYSLRIGPDGLGCSTSKTKPKGTIPYTQEEDEDWNSKFSLPLEFSEFDPANFD